MRAKESFLGRESSDKAFHRWLKIFETFPEGVALIRNNTILYANNSLKHILEVHDFAGKDDTKNEKLKKALMDTNIIPYLSKAEEDRKIAVTNVWQFLVKNEKGATFELQSIMSRYDQEKPSTTKFITLNQVNVNIAGGKDKLLIVREVSHIIYLEQIMETKHEMFLFTDSLMKQIQGYAEFASQSIQKLDTHVDFDGKPIAEESYNEITKMLYRIKDFE